LTMQPQRPLPEGFDGAGVKLKLAIAQSIQPRVRAWARWRYSLRWRGKVERVPRNREYILVDHMQRYDEYEARWWADGYIDRQGVLNAVIEDGWMPLENESDWDLERDGLRLVIACEHHAAGTLVLTRMEMGSKSKGQLSADFVRRLESLGLKRK